MKWFRRTLCESRIFILAFLAVELFYLVDGRNYVYAHQVYEQKEARLKEISELLDIPVEKLRPNHESLFESIWKAFGVEPKDPVKAAGLKRLQEILKKHEEQLAANPYLPQIEEVKREHAIYRIEGIIEDLTQLTDPRGGKALPEASQRALLHNLHHALQEDLKLPVPEGLPAKAQAKLAAFQEKLDRLFESVRPIVAATQKPDMPGTLAQKIAQLQATQSIETKRSSREPRFADRPLPLRRVEKKARTQEVGAEATAKARPPISPPAGASPPGVPSKAGIAPEIVELAESLGNSPANIFTWVHDNIELDPKWGAFKGPLGTLWEKSGTSWDQAWLLRDLLMAAGVDARFEWGEIEISSEILTNITGLEDPFRAGDLLTTAGVPIVLLVQGSQVIAARMSHVWVKAFVDYIPNRGVTAGPGDTWILMDPSLKRHKYADGILIHEAVPFSLGGYLLSATELSPRRFYEDALWSYIRANDINCTTLEQLKPAGSVISEAFPFAPGTLRGKILRVDGETTAVPEAFQQQVQLDIRRAGGLSLMTRTLPWPALYGRRVEIDYRGATPDDQAVLDSFGGVFQTPPYLVDLAPVIKADGVEVAAGAAVGSAEDMEIFVTLIPLGGTATPVSHRTSSGEHHVLALDFGRLPQQILTAHQQALSAAAAAGDEAASTAESLYLIGAYYTHTLSRDLDELAGWKWHRLVKLGTTGLISQTGQVTVDVSGTPLSFTQGPRNVDIARMILGIFAVQGDADLRKETFELLGAQSSFLEGQVFNEVLQHRGIAAVSALTASRREGQTLTLVDAGNVGQVLAQVGLGDDVEQEVAAAVQQGKVAWVAESKIQVSRWRGTGYVLEDPSTGAAAYLISGGFAGGEDVGEFLDLGKGLIGTEAWFESSIVQMLLNLLGKFRPNFARPNDPGTNDGDPINLASGNMWFTVTDSSIRSLGWVLEWRRFYNSRSDYVGPLGAGWTHTYGEVLVEQPDGSVIYRETDGTEHLFTQMSPGVYEAPAGKHLELTKGTAGFDLQTKEGYVIHFGLGGELRTMADRSGNTVTVHYDAAGNLESVTDAAGRVAYSFTTAGGKIVQVTDLAGRVLEYGYDGEDLIAVTDRTGEVWSYAYDNDHNLITKSDPLGDTDSYAYDSLDRCYQHVDPLGNEEMFFYSQYGESAVVRDRRGNDFFFEFDERGRAELMIDPVGNAATSTWDADNNRTSTTDPRGGTTTRTFDGKGNLLSETVPGDNSITFTYDPATSQVLNLTDHTGHGVTNVYDAVGNLRSSTEVVGGVSLVHEATFDALGRATEVRDPRGNEWSLTWHPTKGIVEGITDSSGDTTVLNTDELGRVTAVSNPEGTGIGITWDDEERLVSYVGPRGDVQSWGYDAAGRVTEVTTGLGTTTWVYDAAGRVIEQIDPLGNSVRTEYDEEGRVIARIDAKGNRNSMVYDATGRPAAMIDPLGNIWTVGYCAEIGVSCSTCSRAREAAESFCELTDPQGNTIRQEYDSLGRPNRIVDPLGNVTELSYDDQSRRREIRDPLGRTSSYEYDELGRLTALVTADLSRTEYEYDPAVNLAKVRDPEGREWLNTYDGENRLKTEIDPLGNTATYGYDTAGRLVSILQPDGREVRFNREDGLPKSILFPDGRTDTFQYDAFGRVIAASNGEVSLTYQYDALSRLTSVTDQTLGQTVSYEYDGNGNIASMTGPNGKVEYLYDAKNRLTEQRDPVAGTYRWVYDGLDRRTEFQYPNGVTSSYTYDAAGRLLIVITRGKAGTILDGHAYDYDATGRRTSHRSLHDGTVETYAYDDVNRLSHWHRGADRFEEYTYDRVGNRLARVDDRGSVTYTYDAAHRLRTEVRQGLAGPPVQTDYDWDPNGNLIAKSVAGDQVLYGYDALNRLERIDDGTTLRTYGYAPDGARVRETNQGASRRFLYSFEDVVGTFDGSSNLETYYSHGPRIDEPLAQVGPQTEFLHHDGLGSVTALTAATGGSAGAVSYAPFGGVETASGATSRYGFTGRELDPSGLMYYRARYLDPSVGRFTTKDFIRRKPSQLFGFNHYSYVRNNPVHFVDPTGLVEWDCSFTHLSFSFPLTGIIGIGGGVGFILWDDCSSGPTYPGARWPTASVFTIWGGITWGKLPVAFTYGGLTAIQPFLSFPEPIGFNGIGWIFSAGAGLGLPIFPWWLSVWGYMVNAFNAFFKLKVEHLTAAGPVKWPSDYQSMGFDFGMAFGISINALFSQVWHPMPGY